MNKPHIILLCATARGLTFLRHLINRNDCKLTVFTFKENPEEPPFLQDIQTLCLEHNINCLIYKRIEEAAEFWANVNFDLLFAVSWRYMVPESIFSKAKLGSFVFHDSLLPKYRGFAPTVRAIMNGENYTGASLIKMVNEVDSGDIVEQCGIPIWSYENISDIMNKVTQSYIDIYDFCVNKILDGTVKYNPQNHALATYSPKFTNDDYIIDWKQSTYQILNLIRATTRPYPGATTYYGKKLIKIWAAEPFYGRTYTNYIPGRIVEKLNGRPIIMTQDGAILIYKYSSDIIIPTNITLGKQL
jgi:methionyl-tRNA formyltransferase